MISSRRLAREWALKILYQIDVGKHAPEEALEEALDKLRQEFVQRGSRTASGSRSEQVCLEYITTALRDTLSSLRLPYERALSHAAGRVLEEAPYWQEIRLEASFRTQAPGVRLQPPRLLTPQPDVYFVPKTAEGDSAALAAKERVRILVFVDKAREELAARLDRELRLNARAFAKELASGRPLGAAPEVVQDYLHTQRMAFNAVAIERWGKVGAIVQKQTSDWLRTGAFLVKLVEGTHAKQEEIDTTLGGLASGWRMERQVAVDRNILRLAAFEMLFLPNIPAAASINEAVELAKKYSTAESGRFVNGVLGALVTQIGDQLPTTVATDAIESDDRDDTLDLPEIENAEELEGA